MPILIRLTILRMPGIRNQKLTGKRSAEYVRRLARTINLNLYSIANINMAVETRTSHTSSKLLWNGMGEYFLQVLQPFSKRTINTSDSLDAIN